MKYLKYLLKEVSKKFRKFKKVVKLLENGGKEVKSLRKLLNFWKTGEKRGKRKFKKVVKLLENGEKRGSIKFMWESFRKFESLKVCYGEGVSFKSGEKFRKFKNRESLGKVWGKGEERVG